MESTENKRKRLDEHHSELHRAVKGLLNEPEFVSLPLTVAALKCLTSVKGAVRDKK